MTPDFINGVFEALGGAMIFNHCRVLYRDKKVRGVSFVSCAFFFAWGVWNLYYYPHLDQWWSFAGGLAIVSGNCLWVSLMALYILREKWAPA